MATELTVQSERAYQKQPHIFVNSKAKRAKSTKAGKGGRRWFKDVGLGFRTPKTAIEGTYIGPLSPLAAMILFPFVYVADSLKTRNVLSQGKSLFAVVSSQEPLSLLKCTGRLLSAANTFTSFPNIQDTRSGTRIWPRMYHQRFVWKRVIKSRLGSVGR